MSEEAEEGELPDVLAPHPVFAGRPSGQLNSKAQGKSPQESSRLPARSTQAPAGERTGIGGRPADWQGARRGEEPQRRGPWHGGSVRFGNFVHSDSRAPLPDHMRHLARYDYRSGDGEGPLPQPQRRSVPPVDERFVDREEASSDGEGRLRTRHVQRGPPPPLSALETVADVYSSFSQFQHTSLLGRSGAALQSNPDLPMDAVERYSGGAMRSSERSTLLPLPPERSSLLPLPNARAPLLPLPADPPSGFMHGGARDERDPPIAHVPQPPGKWDAPQSTRFEPPFEVPITVMTGSSSERWATEESNSTVRRGHYTSRWDQHGPAKQHEEQQQKQSERWSVPGEYAAHAQIRDGGADDRTISHHYIGGSAWDKDHYHHHHQPQQQQQVYQWGDRSLSRQRWVDGNSAPARADDGTVRFEHDGGAIEVQQQMQQNWRRREDAEQEHFDGRAPQYIPPPPPYSSRSGFGDGDQVGLGQKRSRSWSDDRLAENSWPRSRGDDRNLPAFYEHQRHGAAAELSAVQVQERGVWSGGGPLAPPPSAGNDRSRVQLEDAESKQPQTHGLIVRQHSQIPPTEDRDVVMSMLEAAKQRALLAPLQDVFVGAPKQLRVFEQELQLLRSRAALQAAQDRLAVSRATAAELVAAADSVMSN